jgi:hypothetical protein
MADRRGFEWIATPGLLRHYHYRWLAEPSGGHRLIEAPKARLERHQRYLLHAILDRIPPHPAAKGFRAGSSILDHATPHAGTPCVLRTDLEDFFLTTRGARVIRVFRAWLTGRVGWVRHVHPQHGAALQELLDTIRW